MQNLASRPSMPPGARLLLPLLALGTAALITGCGKSDKPATEATSQVAAKVDGAEISVHQINYVLTRSKVNADNPEAAKIVRKQILNKLVDQQLLVQKAVEDKLDRSPDVQMALEAARRDVLADAYLQQASGTTLKPDENQLRQYYTDHPELFAQRRVFQLQEVSYAGATPADVQSAIKATVEAGKPLDETLKALKARGVEFARADTQRSSEQISLELLPKLYQLRPGQGMVASSPLTVTAIYLKSYDEAPIGQNAALPRIAQYLTNQSTSQNVQDLVKNLRSKAKIDYVGEFAETGTADPK